MLNCQRRLVYGGVSYGGLGVFLREDQGVSCWFIIYLRAVVFRFTINFLFRYSL